MTADSPLDFSFSTLLRQPHVRELFSILNTHGIDARIVGGAVRDALLGIPIHDIDMAVATDPLRVSAILKAYAPVIPTGLAHGTVTVIFPGNTFQLTSLRRDTATFGRHADVQFDMSFEEDAKRRDFTINALYLDQEGHLFDYFSGQEDLKKGLIRFIGDPMARIQEDYLRILRYFRMQTVYGSGLWHEESLKACSLLAKGVDILSRERIRYEFFKIVTHLRAPFVIATMDKKGILKHVSGQADVTTFQKYSEAEKRYALTSSVVHRLYTLYHEKTLSAMTKEFVLTKNEQKLWSLIMRCGKENPSETELLYFYGKDFAQKFFILKETLLEETIADRMTKLNALELREFPLEASDFQAIGLSGKALGHALSKAKKYWCEKDFHPTRNDLLRKIKSDKT